MTLVEHPCGVCTEIGNFYDLPQRPSLSCKVSAHYRRTREQSRCEWVRRRLPVEPSVEEAVFRSLPRVRPEIVLMEGSFRAKRPSSNLLVRFQTRLRQARHIPELPRHP